MQLQATRGDDVECIRSYHCGTLSTRDDDSASCINLLQVRVFVETRPYTLLFLYIQLIVARAISNIRQNAARIVYARVSIRFLLHQAES